MLQQDLNLKFYDPAQPAILMVDASFEGIGACLLQWQREGPEWEGT